MLAFVVFVASARSAAVGSSGNRGAGRTDEMLHGGSWAMGISGGKTYPRACMRHFFGTLPNI